MWTAAVFLAALLAAGPAQTAAQADGDIDKPTVRMRPLGA